MNGAGEGEAVMSAEARIDRKISETTMRTNGSEIGITIIQKYEEANPLEISDLVSVDVGCFQVLLTLSQIALPSPQLYCDQPVAIVEPRP